MTTDRRPRKVVEDAEMGEMMAERYSGRGGEFTGLPEDNDHEDVNMTDARKNRKSTSIPAKSVEGWIIIVTGVHEEAQDESLLDVFGEYGEVKSIHLNLDRRTGYVKGYALLEYAEKKFAERAIAEADGMDILGRPISVEWAFVKAPRSYVSQVI